MFLDQINLEDYKDQRNDNYNILHYNPLSINEVGKLFYLVEQNYYFLIRKNSELTEEVIGTLAIRIINSQLKLQNIEIRRKFRYKGYGTSLLHFLVRVAQFNSIEKITLVVFNHRETAINIYQKLGFKITKNFKDSKKMEMKL